VALHASFATLYTILLCITAFCVAHYSSAVLPLAVVLLVLVPFVHVQTHCFVVTNVVICRHLNGLPCTAGTPIMTCFPSLTVVALSSCTVHITVMCSSDCCTLRTPMAAAHTTTCLLQCSHCSQPCLQQLVRILMLCSLCQHVSRLNMVYCLIMTLQLAQLSLQGSAGRRVLINCILAITLTAGYRIS
jgi:hypothetical protein